MKKLLSIAIAAAIGSTAVYVFSNWTVDEDNSASPTALVPGGPIVSVRLPDGFTETALVGKRAFDAVCADCHGQNAAGRNGKGPPLVHKIYEPSHHSDVAFFRAVQNGVQAHHWRFGNMPKLQGITDGDVKGIIRYVRELQRVNGID